MSLERFILKEEDIEWLDEPEVEEADEREETDDEN